MSNGDNFAGGFIAGAILGGVLGGVLGATLVSRSGQAGENGRLNGGARKETGSRLGRRRRWISSGDRPGSEERIEEARTSLEDKIAQLNTAIDEARQQLSETEPLGRNGSQAVNQGTGTTQNHAASGPD